MLWGCDSYYQVGPYFIWLKEKVAEKKDNAIILDTPNKYREPICKAFWEEKEQRRREAG
jgi:hypothetical protein